MKSEKMGIIAEDKKNIAETERERTKALIQKRRIATAAKNRLEIARIDEELRTLRDARSRKMSYR